MKVQWQVTAIAQLPSRGKQDVDELLQVRHVFDEFLDPRLELRRTDDADLEPKVAK